VRSLTLFSSSSFARSSTCCASFHSVMSRMRANRRGLPPNTMVVIEISTGTCLPSLLRTTHSNLQLPLLAALLKTIEHAERIRRRQAVFEGQVLYGVSDYAALVPQPNNCSAALLQLITRSPSNSMNGSEEFSKKDRNRASLSLNLASATSLRVTSIQRFTMRSFRSATARCSNVRTAPSAHRYWRTTGMLPISPERTICFHALYASLLAFRSGRAFFISDFVEAFR